MYFILFIYFMYIVCCLYRIGRIWGGRRRRRRRGGWCGGGVRVWRGRWSQWCVWGHYRRWSRTGILELFHFY